MRAAVYRGRNQVAVEDWPVPGPPPPGWVTIDVTWCGICGTDIDEIANGPVYIPTEPHALTGRMAPIVLGHEGVGQVVAVGAGAGLEIGTRVGLENSIGCGTCASCRGGHVQLCPTMAALGLMADGALAERVNVPAAMCAPLPDGLPDEAGALAEPLSVAVRAVRRGGDVRGQVVQVFGGGTIGLLVGQVACALGARAVIVREPSAVRRQVASSLGLQAAALDDPVPESSIVLECSGAAAGLEQALLATAKGGVTVLVGVHAERQSIDLRRLLLHEGSLIASLSHSMTDDYLPALELIREGKIRYEPLITDRIPLEDVMTKGFAPLLGASNGHLKILVDCRS